MTKAEISTSNQSAAMNNENTDPTMERRIAHHQARREAEAKKKSKELTPEEKYDYLTKKDWDEDVIVDNGKWLATDLRGQEFFWLKEI